MKFFLVFVTIIMLSCSTQIEKDIIGKWEKTTEYSRETLTFVDRKVCINVFENTSSFLSKELRQPAVYSLTYSLNGNKLRLSSRVIEYEIMLLDKTEMILKLSRFTDTEEDRKKCYEDLKKVDPEIGSYEEYSNSTERMIGQTEQWKRIQ